MSIGKIVDREFHKVNLYDSVRSVIALLQTNGVVVVFNDDKYEGIVTIKDVLLKPKGLMCDCLKFVKPICETESEEHVWEVMKGSDSDVFPVENSIKDFVGTLKKTSMYSVINDKESRINDLLCRLTVQEKKVAKYIVKGNHTKDIARFLNLSGNTISNHCKSIRSKIGVKNSGITLKTYFNSL